MKSHPLARLCAFLFTFVVSSAHATNYSIVDLGTLGGLRSGGIDINNAGQITGFGYYIAGSNDRHAFLYDNGVMQDLGTLGGIESTGWGINNSGQVVGFSNISGPGSPAHAFLYDGGVMQDLGTLGGADTRAFDINSSGQITGSSDIITGNTTSHAFLYDNGVMQDLGTLGGDSASGRGINDSGQVTGQSRITDAGDQHAFLYDNGVMQDLGTLGGNRSAGTDINNSGQVVGYSSTTESVFNHAFLYDNGVMQDLGTLGGVTSEAWGINDSGQVVGFSLLADGSGVAFLYDGSRMLDLCVLTDCTTKGWDKLTIARSINNHGDITGDGLIDGEFHAFVISAVQDISIDIKPGNDRNIVNPGKKGNIWVAVLSDTASPFDASSQINIPTVEFGPDGANVNRYKVKDSNKDGIGDLLLRFKIPETGIACGDTEANLTGKTFDGLTFTGTDSVKTVGCDKK